MSEVVGVMGGGAAPCPPSRPRSWRWWLAAIPVAIREHTGNLADRDPPDPGTAPDAPPSESTICRPATAASGHDHTTDVADARARINAARAKRLHILEVQRLIRTMPKVVIAVVPDWAAGGGQGAVPPTGRRSPTTSERCFWAPQVPSAAGPRCAADTCGSGEL